MMQSRDLAIRYIERTQEREIPDTPQARELIELVGGADIFTDLMKAVETYNENEARIESFSRIWTDEKTKDSIIKNLMSNEYFYESFLKAKPTRIKTEGNNILCMAYAVEKFAARNRDGKKRKIEIKDLLGKIQRPQTAPTDSVTTFRAGTSILRIPKLDEPLLTLVKDALMGERLNLINKFFADYVRNNNLQYEHFLHRLIQKKIPDNMKRKNTYNDRISAQRKENRLEKRKAIKTKGDESEEEDDGDQSNTTNKMKLRGKRQVYEIDDDAEEEDDEDKSITTDKRQLIGKRQVYELDESESDAEEEDEQDQPNTRDKRKNENDDEEEDEQDQPNTTDKRKQRREQAVNEGNDTMTSNNVHARRAIENRDTAAATNHRDTSAVRNEESKENEIQSRNAHNEDSWLNGFLTLYKKLSSVERRDFQQLIENVMQERLLNQESPPQNVNTPYHQYTNTATNNEQLNEATSPTNQVQQENNIENNEQPNETISKITLVQQENELENSEKINETITTIISQVQQEINMENNEQPNETISTITQVQQENELGNNEQPNETITTIITQVQQENDIENNEQPNETISKITLVQQENELENSEKINETITTIISQVQQEINMENNEQPNETISTITQVQQENELGNNEQPNETIATIITQQEIDEIIPEINQVQHVLKTPKLLREIKMRDKTMVCPHTCHSFFCYCERPDLTPQYIKNNKKTLISNNRAKQISTNSVNRILATYNTIYGEMNTCLPNEFYPLVLRILIDIQPESSKKNPKRKRVEIEAEIGSITQMKMPLDTELNDEKFGECRNVIDGFDKTLWFHDKDKIILPINDADHYILVVISIKLKIIITCDSIKNYELPEELLQDIECMLDYLYPTYKGEWRHDVIRPEEKIQNGTTHTDCGFHILNFAEAALEDRLITTDHADFNMFKEKIELQLDSIKEKERQKILNNQNETNARQGNTNNAILTLENSNLSR